MKYVITKTGTLHLATCPYVRRPDIRTSEWNPGDEMVHACRGCIRGAAPR